LAPNALINNDMRTAETSKNPAVHTHLFHRIVLLRFENLCENHRRNLVRATSFARLAKSKEDPQCLEEVEETHFFISTVRAYPEHESIAARRGTTVALAGVAPRSRGGGVVSKM
jgi:hypothetical protein